METILQAIVSVFLILGALALLTYSFIVNAQTKRSFARMTRSYQQLGETLEQLTSTVKSVDFVAIESAMVERGLITEKADSVQPALPTPRTAHDETLAYVRQIIMNVEAVILLDVDPIWTFDPQSACSLYLTPNHYARQTERVYRMLVNQARHGRPLTYFQLENLQDSNGVWRFDEDDCYEFEEAAGGPGLGGLYRGSAHALA